MQIWLDQTVDPLNWGWELRDDIMLPKMTDLPPAPDDLLKIIKCICKGGCNTLRCGCRINGVECSISCKNCKGTSCLNSPKVVTEEEEIDEQCVED